ncbi:elongation factor 1-alpha [Artemisia annua]|uniref:Elongation factor 1-alpha n=1 Tax=Artemisia annua TaxID=35608 RepID=A0A2U1KT78_ARTAN|nr:elongation factor 1-alpha [Artemisia annua]
MKDLPTLLGVRPQGPNFCLKSLMRSMKPKRYFGKPLCLPLSDVYHIGSIWECAGGGQHYGSSLKLKMSVTFGPSGFTTKVKSIEMHHDAFSEAILRNTSDLL